MEVPKIRSRRIISGKLFLTLLTVEKGKTSKDALFLLRLPLFRNKILSCAKTNSRDIYFVEKNSIMAGRGIYIFIYI